tara:strand:- start:7093 stop:7566 length:474 start_codon:yes stop_codon:yes gene_type:complete
MIQKIKEQLYHPKVISLFISIIVFSVIYLFLDDNHFSGVNYIKETIKKEVIKKKIDKKIEEDKIEPFTTNFTNPYLSQYNVEKKLQETTQDVKQNVKDEELIPEKIEVPIYQKLFDRIYFSIVTGTLLGYGDIYPTTNICKAITMLQGLFTIALIVY